MKLYQNSICVLLISGCADCPNKKAARYKTSTGFKSRYECQTLNHNRYDYSVAGNKLTFHPPLTEVIREGGFLEDCPLPDAESVEASSSLMSTSVGANGGSPASIPSTTPKTTPQGA